MLSQKNGSYKNGLDAFIKVFKESFQNESFSEKNYSSEGSMTISTKDNVKIVEIDWILDDGGLYITIQSEFFNKPHTGTTICNRPCRPLAANNYVMAAHYRRKKPKYKHEACSIVKQIKANFQKSLKADK